MQYLSRKNKIISPPKYKRRIIPGDLIFLYQYERFFRITEEEHEFIEMHATKEEMDMLFDCAMLEEKDFAVMRKSLVVLNKYLDMFDNRKEPLIPYSMKTKYRKLRRSIPKWIRHQLFVLGLPGGFPDFYSEWWHKKTEKDEREFAEKKLQEKNENQ